MGQRGAQLTFFSDIRVFKAKTGLFEFHQDCIETNVTQMMTFSIFSQKVCYISYLDIVL